MNQLGLHLPALTVKDALVAVATDGQPPAPDVEVETDGGAATTAGAVHAYRLADTVLANRQHPHVA